MCFIVGRWNICFSHCYQLSVCSAHPVQSRPVLSGRSQGSLPWDSPFLGNAHRIFSFPFWGIQGKYYPGEISKDFLTSARETGAHIFGLIKMGDTSAVAMVQTSHSPCSTVSWSMQKTSILSDHCLHNKFERLSLEFKFLHNLAPADLSDHIVRYTHSRSCQTKPLLFPDPQPKPCASFCPFFNSK